MRRISLLVVPLALPVLAACGGAGGQKDAVATERLAELRQASNVFAGLSVDILTTDAAALALGAELFIAYCADCHQADGTGARGVTDLTAGRYDYGTSAAAIQTTIRDGRRSVMPDFGDRYNEFGTGQLVSYVDGLSAGNASSQQTVAGRESYLEACAACHGDDGKGQALIGTPDLTDAYWQYSDSLTSVRSIIANGVESECPPQRDGLSPAEIDILTAYVLSLIDQS